MTIYLVRHGEAAASWQQNKDPGLSEKGRAQAKALPDFFAGQRIDRIYSSPLLRAQETAQPLSLRLGLDVKLVEAFREIPTPPDVPLQERLQWLKSCVHRPLAEADPVVISWRASLLEAVGKLPDHSIVFSHFMVLNAVVGSLRGAPELVCYQPDYCSVLMLGYDCGEVCLQRLGREAHSRVL